MRLGNLQFAEVTCCDFEFIQPTAERPDPICMVAVELSSHQVHRLWREDLLSMKQAPFPTDKDSLFISYNAPAELMCFLVLGWPLPTYVLDLYVEFAMLVNRFKISLNGTEPKPSKGLVNCLRYFGLKDIDPAYKEFMQQKVLKGGPWSNDEQREILEYCQEDVDVLIKLLPRMEPLLNLNEAVLRGRFQKSISHMQHTGTPVDVPMLEALKTHWGSIKECVIEQVNSQIPVFEGLTFKTDRFVKFLVDHQIPWPLLPSGVPRLDKETFKAMSNAQPLVSPLYDARLLLSQLRRIEIAVGSDQRNRCSLFPFTTVTGRNAPKAREYIFQLSKWVRSLIKPPVGHGIAYVDFCQCEFGVSAALSDDFVMQKAYSSGDPYLSLGRQIGLIPENGTKHTHKRERDLCKACVLAMNYQMGPENLAIRINKPLRFARELLEQQRKTYWKYQEWLNECIRYATFTGELSTNLGWKCFVRGGYNGRTLGNFPTQATAQEVFRHACNEAIEQGIKICAPVHDAVLLESPLERLDEDVALCCKVFEKSSAQVLYGFGLRTDVEIFRYPERFMEPQGQGMWNAISSILQRLEGERFNVSE
jgi:hypothetical protein